MISNLWFQIYELFFFSSCTTLIVSIFQFASSILRFGAKKLGPRRWIWILMSGPPVENRNTLVSQKRVQRYSFFLIWPNIFAKKIHLKCILLVKVLKMRKLKNALFLGYFWGIWGKRAKVGIWSILYVCATRIYKERVCARNKGVRCTVYSVGCTCVQCTVYGVGCTV